MTIDGVPTDVNDTAISSGGLLITLADATQLRTTAMTYVPDGAIGFANGGDVADTETWTLYPANTITVAAANIDSAHTMRLIFSQYLTEFDGTTGDFHVTKNGVPCTVTGLSNPDGTLFVTTSQTIDTGTIAVSWATAAGVNWTFWYGNNKNPVPTSVTLPYSNAAPN